MKLIPLPAIGIYLWGEVATSAISPLKNLMNFPVCLAPMVGLSHVALRSVMRPYLPQGAHTIWPTEMLNSRRLPHEKFELTPEILREPDETGLVPQILGNDEECITKSVLRLQHWGAEGIDINMGCPVEKALRHNYGVALMGDSVYAANVVRMTVKASTLPVSVKLRAVTEADNTPLRLLEFVGGLQEAGASWITLHPRTKEQKRRGNADWSQIQYLKAKLDIPVLGNGDVQTWQDVLRMQAETGCDAVMIGRALAARPWMLWQLGEEWGWPAPSGRSGEEAPRTPAEEAREYGLFLQRLLPKMVHHFGENLALRKFRFYLRTTSVWLNFGHNLYSVANKEKTSTDILKILPEFFKQGVEMVPMTELRQ